MLDFIATFVDANKIGGWVRAGVAALLGLLIAKWPALTAIFGPDVQNALGVLVSGIVVGVWSTLVKSDAAKVQMAAAIPSVKRIEVTDPVLAAVPAPEVQLARVASQSPTR